ncbi:MAG: recombinase family protein [Romboutsia sp.]
MGGELMKVAIYSRKSKFTSKGESIENQIQLCMDYGKNIGVKDFLVYEDEGFSGKNTNRPQFSKMIEDAKSKKFDTIICYRLDRISRNVADFSSLIDDLSSLGIGFISIKEQFDTTTPMGRAMMFISSVFAQLERETISERVRDNMRELAKDGKWLGGQLPLGYKNEVVNYISDGKERKYNILKVNDKEITLVEDIYNKFLEVRSLTKVSEYLYKQGICGKNGGTISPSMVKDILTNPIYVKSSKFTHEYFELNEIFVTGDFNGCGYLTYGKNKNGKKVDKCNWIYAVSKHNGLINDIIWLDIQRIVDKQSKKGCRTGSGKNGVLSGILKCAKCGSAMVLTYSSYGKGDDKVRSYYYKCNKKYTMYNCTNSNINGKEIEDFVLDKIKVTDKDVLIGEYKELRNTFNSIKPKSNINIQGDIDTNEKAIEQLVMQLTKNSTSAASKYIIVQIEKLSAEVDELKKKFDGVSEVSNSIEVEMLNIDLIVENLNKFNKCVDDASVEEKKLLVSSVVDKITWDGDEVRIFYHGLEGSQFDSDSLCLDTDGFCMPYKKTSLLSSNK